MAASASAATMTLSLTYLGSTTATGMTGLSVKNLSDPTFETPSWNHVFSVNVASFTPDPSTTQALRLLTFNVNVNGSPAPVGSGGPMVVPTSPNSNYIGNNPNLPGPNSTPTTPSTVAFFKDNSDAGTDLHDSFAILIDQTSSYAAYTGKAGQPGSQLTPTNRLGRIAMQFTGPISQNVTLSVVESDGQSFSWFNANDANNNNFSTTVGGVTGASIVIPPGVPEPASLGVLGLGGLALLARRRRTA